jgi:hypothetical protein
MRYAVAVSRWLRRSGCAALCAQASRRAGVQSLMMTANACVQVEYAPCDSLAQCEGLMQELMSYIVPNDGTGAREDWVRRYYTRGCAHSLYAASRARRIRFHFTMTSQL